MEQDMKETNLLEEQTKVEEWLTEKNIDEQQEIQHSIIFYKHGANNMAEMSVENSNKLQMNAAWLKGIATGDTNLTSRFILHSEAGLVETYLLIRDTLNLQTIDESQEPLSVSNKNFAESSVKFKQRKNTKPLKEHKESMKRIKQPENWKVNLKKNARLKGEEYIGVGGKIVPAKKMGHPCVCRMHCAEKIDEKEREELHKSFWRIYTWQQRKQYIAKSVKESPKQRTRLRNNVQPERSSRCRQVTFTYSLLLKGEFITVCKSMFLSTFAISEKFVRHVMEKKRMSPSGIIEPDQRGRHMPKTKKSEDIKERVREHIRSFPSEKSTDPKDHSDRCYLDANLNIATMHKSYVSKCKQTGVPESDIVKESYYREMFKTEFNLGFKRVQAKEIDVKR
ncbi:PREDICTED: uncharacterized protein LOC105144465 isoform X1 [Acromyrmex echinatior]|uniref:Uncharacterized protein n=1 Tax=Acromyrmex echinatior TaxID=103372 RepID=F4WF32_ACREC|nr:PREDICTED: uncharacterized protein LOC105144465 isoform X1 [Acromyrmex echinatior]XP_011051677.1 PREDICTED: uncharacterized protein LOC105144465 isoform X1 [Acromyrmex echinatior]XP_011051678.1 PREDICTED: uncharacterized protein LOC105144465 isoform X1 [Acromyrmex echinatior]EGI67083.1 hypothetical protein G5I_04238 [Acromyrmex echinatior]